MVEKVTLSMWVRVRANESKMPETSRKAYSERFRNSVHSFETENIYILTNDVAYASL